MSQRPIRTLSDPNDSPNVPWWRVHMVWLVISGPAVVVVAAIVTAVIAIRGADPVIKDEPDAAFADKPALQGRNHAAGAPVKK
jgi:hypothetical protein